MLTELTAAGELSGWFRSGIWNQFRWKMLPCFLQSVKRGWTNKSCHKPQFLLWRMTRHQNISWCLKIYFCVLHWDSVWTDGLWSDPEQQIFKQLKLADWFPLSRWSSLSCIVCMFCVCVCANFKWERVLWWAVGWGETEKPNFLYPYSGVPERGHLLLPHCTSKIQPEGFFILLFYVKMNMFCDQSTLKYCTGYSFLLLWRFPREQKPPQWPPSFWEGRSLDPPEHFTELDVQPSWKIWRKETAMWPRTQWSLWLSSRDAACRWENVPEGQASLQLSTNRSFMTECPDRS